MRILLVLSLLVPSVTFAQILNLEEMKNHLLRNKASLEEVHQGMSGKFITKSSFQTENGSCEMTETVVQTVLKIEGEQIIVYSKEKYEPAATSACKGFETQEAAVLFYEGKPSVEKEIKGLVENASTLTSILKSGNIFTLTFLEQEGRITLKMDLSKSLFKNTLYLEAHGQKTTGEDHADISVNNIDLSNVLFCESRDSDNCSEGDYSDILY